MNRQRWKPDFRSALVLLVLVAGAMPQSAAPLAREGQVTVLLTALADTVVAHQTAWIEVRITNGTTGTLSVPFLSGKIIGAWRFESGSGEVVSDWPEAAVLQDAPQLTLAAGETLYEVLSPESCFGILTGPGTVRALCRVGEATSRPVQLSRRAADSGDPPSVLRDAGPMHRSNEREGIQMRLWSTCAEAGDYLDCDEALFTVAWDRLQVAPAKAVAVIDTLVARSPRSGWCRPALLELASRLPKAAARRELESHAATGAGGVAGAYAAELLRRLRHGEFPLPGQ